MQEDEKKRAFYFKDTYLKLYMTLPLTFKWQEFSHMSTSNSKGEWECDIYTKKCCAQQKKK